MKGSQIKSKAEQVELNRMLAEFSEKLETDPYQPGIVHPHLCSDDLQDVIEDLLWIRGNSEITIKVKKESEIDRISIEILDRKNTLTNE